MIRDRRLFVAALLLVAVSGVGAADTPSAEQVRALHLAARSGDVPALARLLDAGVPVDAADDWGTTALYLAAKQNQVATAAALLERGADPDARETFFGSSALGMALWKGGPDYEIARALLAAGATERARAIEHAFENGDVDLARFAVEAGPVTESEAADLRARYADAMEELRVLLGALKTRPDPPPPSYTAEELAAFAGTFEEGSASATVRAVDGGLEVDYRDAMKTKVVLVGEREFENAEAGLTLRFHARAGSIEGVEVTLGDARPRRLRLAGDEGAVLRPEAAAPADTARAADAATVASWPGFRGANRDGIGDGATAPPVDFDPMTGKDVAWTAELPGLGNSSPVVHGDRVYVTTAVAEGGSEALRVGRTGAGDEVEEQVEHRWLVLAFDRATGQKLWEREVGRAVPLTNRHFKATQANSTPVTDGEHLVVVFPTAGLACLDAADGTLHWKRELGGLNAGGFNDPGMQWGFAASPILHEGKVVLQVDIHSGPYIAAWDLATGKPLWKTARPDVAPSWATPAIWRGPDGDEIVANASVIRGYAPDDGRELWSLGPTSVQVVASPVVSPAGRLYVSSGYPPARPIYAVEPGIRGAHTIDSTDDARAASLAWYRTRGGAYMPTPLLYRGLLYIVHHDGRLVAHDAATGEPVWKARLSAGGTCTASPVAVNGTVWVGTEEGLMYVLDAGNEYRELAVREFHQPLMATPAIVDGVVYVRTPSKLIALARTKSTPESDRR